MASLPAAGFTTDSQVETVAAGSGNLLFLGGSFSSLSRRTGHWVRFDASGARDVTWPEVDGPVRAVVADGAGGWYVGGAFAHVAGQPRAGLAHVGPGGELDQIWSPDVIDYWDRGPGEVTALAVVGDTVFVAGDFDEIDGHERNTLAAVDAVSGRVRAWNSRLDGWNVNALAVAGRRLFVAGDFTRVGSTRRAHLAAVDVATGALDAWNPGVSGQDFPGDDVTVRDVVVDHETLYVGGQFDVIDGVARPGVAAFDVATGALTAWNPREINRAINSVFKLAVADGTVYVGLHLGFDTERCRQLTGGGYLVAIDAGKSAGVRWCAGLSPVFALAVAGDRVYGGGGWPGYEQRFLRVVSAGTGVLGGFHPRPDGPVSSLVWTGDGLLAGGEFSGFDRQTRTNGAAVDLDTGVLLPFDPEVGGFTVEAMATHGESVFAAGEFERIGGRQRRSLAKLDATTGRALRWDPRLRSRGRAHALAVYGDRLYVGGGFRSIGGRSRRGLAALDTSTGRATQWRMNTDGRVRALAVDGHTLYVAGDFTRIGEHRRRHVGAIDLRSGRVTAWRPDPDGRVRALAFAGQRVYLGGDFHRVGGKRRARLAAVDVSVGKADRWRANTNRAVHALAVVQNNVFAGGDFTKIGGASRSRIAALDAGTGAPTTWNPGTDAHVSGLLATPHGLVATGSFTSLGGTSQTGIGVFPLSDAMP